MPLDPALQPILDLINEQVAPSNPNATPQEMRAAAHAGMELGFIAMGDDPVDVASVVDHRVPVDGGEITVRVYTPFGDGPFPGYLYIHGGGFWLGTIDHFDPICRAIAIGANCVVANVDYRLAPEFKFPTAPEDCYAALQWLAASAAELHVDADNLAVGGGSAGGNLAAVVALMARDRGGPALKFQVLEIPVTDLTMSHPSITENGEGYVLTKDGMVQCVSFYLADPADTTHPYASPFFADDLSGLPPALVVTAEYDPLRDEGEAYAKRLQEAGVPTVLVRMDGHIHGSMGFTKLMPSAVEHRDRVIDTLTAAYGHVS
jgi:acetyl esterase